MILIILFLYLLFNLVLLNASNQLYCWSCWNNLRNNAKNNSNFPFPRRRKVSADCELLKTTAKNGSAQSREGIGIFRTWSVNELHEQFPRKQAAVYTSGRGNGRQFDIFWNFWSRWQGALKRKLWTWVVQN